MLYGDYSAWKPGDIFQNHSQPDQVEQTQTEESSHPHNPTTEEKETKQGHYSQVLTTGQLKQEGVLFQLALGDMMATDLENPPPLGDELPPLLLKSFEAIPVTDISLSEAAASPPVSFKELISSVDNYKTSLGSDENTARPHLILNKTFLFFPINSVRNFVNKALKNEWQPSSFWKLFAQKIGLSPEGLSKYEYVSLTLQSFSKIKDYQKEMNQRLLEANNPNRFMQEISGLSCHPGTNSAQSLIQTIEYTLKIVEEQYAYHKKKGTLEAFFNEAFDDSNICFEARARHLQEYANNNPIMNNKTVDVNILPDYTRESPFNKIFEEELRVLRETKKRNHTLKEDENITGEEFKNYLINERKILEVEGKEKKESQTIRLITEQDVDALIEFYRDTVMILD